MSVYFFTKTKGEFKAMNMVVISALEKGRGIIRSRFVKKDFMLEKEKTMEKNDRSFIIG